METLIIGHHNGGWCVFRTVPNETPEIVSGPHRDHADAMQAAESRAFRVALCWCTVHNVPVIDNRELPRVAAERKLYEIERY